MQPTHTSFSSPLYPRSPSTPPPVNSPLEAVSRPCPYFREQATELVLALWFLWLIELLSFLSRLQ